MSIVLLSLTQTCPNPTHISTPKGLYNACCHYRHIALPEHIAITSCQVLVEWTRWQHCSSGASNLWPFCYKSYHLTNWAISASQIIPRMTCAKAKQTTCLLWNISFSVRRWCISLLEARAIIFCIYIVDKAKSFCLLSILGYSVSRFAKTGSKGKIFTKLIITIEMNWYTHCSYIWHL